MTGWLLTGIPLAPALPSRSSEWLLGRPPRAPIVVHRNIEAWFPNNSLLPLLLVSFTLTHAGPSTYHPSVIILTR
jgi:hypothetical protein